MPLHFYIIDFKLIFAFIFLLGEEVQNRYLYSLVKRLNEWYPNDVGVFMPFFLNYFTLQPGECMFIASGVPHAYIKGG